jgi:hypothetical protein
MFFGQGLSPCPASPYRERPAADVQAPRRRCVRERPGALDPELIKPMGALEEARSQVYLAQGKRGDINPTQGKQPGPWRPTSLNSRKPLFIKCLLFPGAAIGGTLKGVGGQRKSGRLSKDGAIQHHVGVAEPQRNGFGEPAGGTG